MANKFYAVRVGKTPGVYMTWEQCKANVDGYSGAIYKSFPTLAEAKAFAGIMDDEIIADVVDDQAVKECFEIEENYAFVDGSFNASTGVYGYGGFLVSNGEKHILTGSGNDSEMSSMRNVSGEVLGSTAAVSLAMKLGLKKLVIYYDYMGIEMWASGSWKRNKKGTIAYYEFMQEAKQKIEIQFVKVKGHSGIEGNEEADRLAKQAVGLL